MKQQHIRQWASASGGRLSCDENGDEKTDYSRWPLVDKQGRQSWCYLESDEEAKNWPQTVYDKCFLGLNTGLPDLPKAETPRQAATDGVSQWASEFIGPNFVMPIVVIGWWVTNTPIPPATRSRSNASLFATQSADDGGWGGHVQTPGYSAIGTVLNYVTLRLLGASEDDPRLVKARALIHEFGGAVYAPGIAKFWLSVLGVMNWECVNPFLPELASETEPTFPSKWYIHTRPNFTSMSFVWSKQWSYCGDAITEKLRAELYTQPNEIINFAAHRSSLAEVDNNFPKWWLVKLMNWFTVAIYIPYMRKASTVKLAEEKVWEMLRTKNKNTEYLGISPISKVVNLIGCFIHDGEGSESVWDTSLAVQAIVAAGDAADKVQLHQQTLVCGHGFLNDHQLRENVPDHEKYHRPHRKGGWPFSTRYQGYALSECTGEALRAVLPLQGDSELLLLTKIDKISTDRLQDAVDCMLQMQNDDTGGFAVYEKRKGSQKLAWLEMGEFAGKTMVTYDFVECATARFYPDYRADDIAAAKQSQNADGGWNAAWGICFTYGGMFALETLALVVGETYTGGSETVCKGRRMADGGSAEYPDKEVIKKGLKLIMTRQQSKGQWLQETFEGGVQDGVISFSNYKLVWPVRALAEYARRFGNEGF
ncbi:oxidosqualene:lanosterol cyclase [Apodospora peruviana]|uniref:Oxidosqualene:lanosterol cyclase n=1 Tax=Apodospora peruviana TaxID=516989 RepID=A0AAE0M5H9_9PEZI|nr:oxidosqualene:lanosterol cyclase [Apodospora peruviana]